MRDLGRRAVGALVWAGAADAAGKLLVFVATLVLARLLVPSEFGLVAFCLSVVYALEYVGDLGLGAALIYRSDAEDPRVSSTAFWIGIIGSLVLYAGCWLVAPLLADVGPGDEVVSLFRVLALYFPLTALGKAHEYRLRRSLGFRTLFGPKLASGVTKGSGRRPLGGGTIISVKCRLTSGGETQARPSRPRPAVCVSARTTAPWPTRQRSSMRRASSIVDSVEGRYMKRRPA